MRSKIMIGVIAVFQEPEPVLREFPIDRESRVYDLRSSDGAPEKSLCIYELFVTDMLTY